MDSLQTDERSYYEENGYVVLQQVVSQDRIDQLLQLYRTQIVPATTKFYRQNTNLYTCNSINEYGHVTESFLDVHGYQKFPGFQQSALALFFDERVRDALRRLTGSPAHNLMQSMLFDRNTETPPHQDWWYLDTVPAGGLIAAWIALEDIHEEAGRFYVLPGSHRVVLHPEPNTMPHSEWLARMRRYVDEHADAVRAPELRKGDVLFWNSRTIHGARPTRNPTYSRKSLTAHYIPAQMAFGNIFKRKDFVQYRNYGEFQYFANQPEYSVKSVVLSKIKTSIYDNPLLLKAARALQRRSLSGV